MAQDGGSRGEGGDSARLAAFFYIY